MGEPVDSIAEQGAAVESGDWIRGITVRQPWATCILAGKRTENRPKHWLMGS
ncbi:hypothetical protein GQF42_44555 [Streptomyces broussonetiae]|uniref:Uncharacterized protein n=1 Tax=Streptomyces broussonetiae TaxID=2686304 RepID=A0A6I6ND17_9ACTN|nr:hypothetical protein [Streptomyces broussonetiae]QHA09304.1 hypothetical protein GQF42_44555 [Streptomyces broussonetiae]